MRQLLHFKTGLLGWSARLFLRLSQQPETLEETVALPVLVSVCGFVLFANGKVSSSASLSYFIIITLVSGAWFGAKRGFNAVLRAMLRGLFIGALIAEGTFLAANQIELKVDWPKFALLTIYFAAMVFLTGHLLMGMFRDVCLLSEAQWQIAERRRNQGIRIIEMALREKVPDDAPFSDLVAVKIIRAIGLFMAAALFGGGLVGLLTPAIWHFVRGVF